MSVTCGANLKPIRGNVAKKFSTAMNSFMKTIEKLDPANKVGYGGRPAIKLFVKAGAPVTNTSADSPGSDLCFIWDSTNLDLYIAHGWSAAGTFTILKVLD